MENRIFRAEIPYIEVTNMCESKNMVPRLREALAARGGEMTSVHKYVYCSLVLKDENQEVSEILEGIAAVEMQHMKMLMQMIMACGCYPVYSYDSYCSGKRKEMFWNAGFVKYMLISFLSDKNNAINNYINLADSCDNEEAAAILKRIVMDEKIHCELLTDLFEKYK